MFCFERRDIPGTSNQRDISHPMLATRAPFLPEATKDAVPSEQVKFHKAIHHKILKVSQWLLLSVAFYFLSTGYIYAITCWVHNLVSRCAGRPVHGNTPPSIVPHFRNAQSHVTVRSLSSDLQYLNHNSGAGRRESTPSAHTVLAFGHNHEDYTLRPGLLLPGARLQPAACWRSATTMQGAAHCLCVEEVRHIKPHSCTQWRG